MEYLESLTWLLGVSSKVLDCLPVLKSLTSSKQFTTHITTAQFINSLQQYIVFLFSSIDEHVTHGL